MKKIIFSRPDGGVSVVVPVINTLPENENITEAQAEQRAWDKLPVGAINPQFVTDAEIPTDRMFRDTWKLQSGKIECDLPKCKAIAHEKRRAARVRQFAPLDIEATIPSKAAAAEAARQKIRDKDAAIQSQIDSAMDVQSLKTIVESFK